MVLNRQHAIRVSTASLAQFLSRVQRTLGITGSECAVCLITDKEMARLNQEFRAKRGPTDVLSFPSDEERNGKSRRLMRSRNSRTKSGRHVTRSLTSFTSLTSSTSFFLGDIAISPETARRNAQRFGRTLHDELRILVLHGVLHLMGYDHETDNGTMDRIERSLRRRLGFEVGGNAAANRNSPSARVTLMGRRGARKELQG